MLGAVRFVWSLMSGRNRMMRRHLAAIMTSCPVSLFETDANATTRGANRGVEHRHSEDSDNEASLVGFLSHSYYYRTTLPDLFPEAQMNPHGSGGRLDMGFQAATLCVSSNSDGALSLNRRSLALD